MKLSILIPTRNRPALALRAVNSVFSAMAGRNKHLEFEVILADNSDPTKEIFGAQWSMIYLPPASKPLTMWDNWQRALDHATGDYVMVMNDKSEMVEGAPNRLLDAMLDQFSLVTWRIRRSRKDLKTVDGAWFMHAEDCYKLLFRHWDETDIFPHGVNMLWRRDIFQGRLFEAINPDYRAGIRLLRYSCGVHRIERSITFIDPKNSPKDSVGASVTLDLPTGEEFKKSLGERRARIHDPSFPIDYILEDLKEEGITVDRTHLGARYLKHLAIRLRHGILPNRQQIRRARMIGLSNWRTFLGDAMRSPLK